MKLTESIILDDKIDQEGDLMITIDFEGQEGYFWLDKEESIKFIKHLKEQFKID